jgi:TolA-binding protein
MIEPVTDEERLDRRQWIQPDLSSARIEAGFQGVLAKEAKEKTSARAVVVAATMVTAAAAAALFVILSGDDAASPFVGTELTTHADPLTVSLADGSSIEAEPHTSLSLLSGEEDEVSFALSRGGATFEVAVERGIVEVHASGEVIRLHAGERWERTDAVTPARAEEHASAEQVPEEDVVEAVSDRSPRRPRVERVTPAEMLFDEARLARGEQRHADAAQAYEQLITRHPGDRRAGLAALELGRLRMDRLGDPAGAAEAFTTSLRLSPRSPLREDTMARLVRAHEAAGSNAACGRVKARYLERYPDGRHVTDITRRCE